MTDYIKREDAIEEACKGCNEEFSEEPCEPSDCCIMQRLADIPSADVVEVVRCKDCIHKPNGYTDDDVLRYPNFPNEENNPCPCQVYEDKWYSWIPNDDFYCSYGERADK